MAMSSLKGTDRLGSFINSSAVFAQNWENGSRMAAAASNSPDSVINPENKYFSVFIKSAVKFCLNKVFISFIEPDFACYRNGENVRIRYELNNFSINAANLELEVDVLGENGDCIKRRVPLNIGESCTESGYIDAGSFEFESDFYSVNARVIIGGRVVSKASNGFVLWNDKVARKGPAVGIKNNRFIIGGEPHVITGTNYYESNIGELMWIRPDIFKLNEDFKSMAQSGMNYVRIHYHHAKWFKDYMNYSIGKVPGYFEGVSEDPLPDERILRIFDAHIYLCQKYGIIYGGDLFTLIPKEMGDPRGWYGIQDYLWFDKKIEVQKKFLELLIPRYTNIPGIAWDLYNEPKDVDDERFGVWSKLIGNFIKGLGDNHIITVGVEFPERYTESVDFLSEHRNFKMINSIKNSSLKPVILQEAWLDRPTTPKGDEMQFEDMRYALFGVFGSGLNGFAPWQWTNQARLRNDYLSYIGEIWDDRLGSCVRNDGTFKPSGLYYKDFAHIIGGIEFRGQGNYQIETNMGLLEIDTLQSENEKKETGCFYLKHYNDDKLFAGISSGAVCWNGNTYMEADSGCDIFFCTSAANGLEYKGEMYFKVFGSARIKIYNKDSAKPFVTLRRNPADGEDLFPVKFSLHEDCVELENKDWYSSYWLHISR